MALSKTLFVAAVFLQSGDEPRAGHELVREQPRAVRLAQHQPEEGATEGRWHCELRLELETKVHEVFSAYLVLLLLLKVPTIYHLLRDCKTSRRLVSSSFDSPISAWKGPPHISYLLIFNNHL